MMCTNRKILLPLYMFIVIFIAVACGGGGGGSVAGGGIGGTGITSGTVTGFGSVYVNGVEYFMENTMLYIDDDFQQDNVSEDNFNLEDVLDLDMVVTVTWQENADGTFTATSVAYDEEVEGPVAAGSLADEDATTQTRQFTVLGVAVTVGRNSTSFIGWANGYEDIAEGEVVEVSGFFDENGVLVATRVEKEADLQLHTEIEIKGVVAGYTSGDTEFNLGDITVAIGSITLPQGFADGEIVEVHGVVTELAPVITISATEIEIEDDGLGDTGDATVSLEGIVTSYTSNSSFEVNGYAVDATGALFEPTSLEVTLGLGDRVEVEGPIIGGVLMASAVEARGNEVRINAVAIAVSQIEGTILLDVVDGQPALTVRVNNETEFEDEQEGISEFGLADIRQDDYLQLEAFIGGSGELVADQVVRDEPDDIELQGPVDAASGDSNSGNLTILGVTVMTGDATEFENENETKISGAEFFAQVQEGDLVRFRDEWLADGLAEKVEFEN